MGINPLKAELNPMWEILALLEAHHILHVSRIRIKIVRSKLQRKARKLLVL